MPFGRTATTVLFYFWPSSRDVNLHTYSRPQSCRPTNQQHWLVNFLCSQQHKGPAPSEGRERKRERIGTVHTGGPPLRQPLLQAKHGTTHRTEGDEGGPSDAVVIRSAVKSAAHRQKQRVFFWQMVGHNKSNKHLFYNGKFCRDSNLKHSIYCSNSLPKITLCSCHWCSEWEC